MVELLIAALAFAAARVDDGHPVWSHDGRYVAFDRTRELGGGFTNTSIEIVRSDGRRLRHITPTSVSVDAVRPVWSPDDGWLAFEVASRYLPTTVQWERRNGRNANALSIGSDSSNTVSAPSWAPDNRRLAVAARHPELTPCPPEVETSRPSWSPDGRRIAYSVCRRPVCSVFVAPAGPNAVGGVQIPRARDPAWAPNGRLIVYTHVAGSAPTRLYLVRPDGHGVHPLIRGQ